MQTTCFESSYLEKYPYREKSLAGLTLQQELRSSEGRATGSNNAGKVSGTKAQPPAVQAARSPWSASVWLPALKRPCTPRNGNAPQPAWTASHQQQQQSGSWKCMETKQRVIPKST